MPNSVYRGLLEPVESLLGPRLAQAAVRLPCAAAGVSPEELTARDVERILGPLYVVLQIYVGRVVARQVERQLHNQFWT